MNILSGLPKTTTKGAKRVGRGYGSGVGGHTTGRGQKGQKARGSVSIMFTGTKVKKSLLQRLPALRGKSKMKSLKPSAVTIPVRKLNTLGAKTEVTIESLRAHGLLTAKQNAKLTVKIVGDGKLSVLLTVAVPVSATARQKIEAAGGQVIVDHE